MVKKKLGNFQYPDKYNTVVIDLKQVILFSSTFVPQIYLYVKMYVNCKFVSGLTESDHWADSTAEKYTGKDELITYCVCIVTVLIRK